VFTPLYDEAFSSIYVTGKNRKTCENRKGRRDRKTGFVTFKLRNGLWCPRTVKKGENRQKFYKHLYIWKCAQKLYKITSFKKINPPTRFSIYRQSQGDVNKRNTCRYFMLFVSVRVVVQQNKTNQCTIFSFYSKSSATCFGISSAILKGDYPCNPPWEWQKICRNMSGKNYNKKWLVILLEKGRRYAETCRGRIIIKTEYCAFVVFILLYQYVILTHQSYT
jgi:hypothetical protein